MFDTLDDQIKKDLDKQSTPKQRMLMYLVIIVAAVLLFGGLYFGVRMID